MFSHLCLGTSEFGRAFGFYEGLMAELGLVLKFRDRDTEWAGWIMPNEPRPLFLLCKPYDGDAASSGNGQMVAFLAPDRATVDRAHIHALANGARDEGGPGLRPRYHPHYYGAYFRDLDGNKICVCCHEPAPDEEV